MPKLFNDAKKIKDRMEKDAIKIYSDHIGQNLNRLEGFDPLVEMLLGACASEFKTISQEILNSWSRMLEQLAKMLIPEGQTGALPAHAIAHARARDFEGATRRSKDILTLSGYAGKDLSFSPCGNYQIWNGDVKYLASGQTICSYEEIPFKTEVLRSTKSQKLRAETIWLGLEVENPANLPDQLTFFFDWPPEFEAHLVQEMLNVSIWSMGEEEIPATAGQIVAHKGYSGYDEFQLVHQVESQIQKPYLHQFISVKIPRGRLALHPYPAEFISVFDANELDKQLDRDLLWLKVEFSSAFFPSQAQSANILDRVVCLTNCFPVLNRELHEPTFRLENDINIFALNNGHFFLSVEEVVNTKLNIHYRERPFLDIISDTPSRKEDEVRIFSLRKEGVNRFDDRNAVEFIENLLYLIREENFIFSALSRQTITQNLKLIRRAVNDIETSINQQKKEKQIAPEAACYIAFPPGDREGILVRYWSTNGFQANGIPSGETLQEKRGEVSFVAENLRLVTGTRGGRDPFKKKDRIQEFKAALIVKEKIVTEEDIRLYCLQKMGQFLESVEISKGIDIGLNATDGLRRIIEVRLWPKPEVENSEKMLLTAKRQLELELNEKSSFILPVRVFVSLE